MTMALKRKRSYPTINSPFSDAFSSGGFSSPTSLPFFFAQTKPTEPYYEKPTWSFPTYESDDRSSSRVSAYQMNSRTQKRHRDDRPDEEAIFGTFQTACVV